MQGHSLVIHPTGRRPRGLCRSGMLEGPSKRGRGKIKDSTEIGGKKNLCKPRQKKFRERTLLAKNLPTRRKRGEGGGNGGDQGPVGAGKILNKRKDSLDRW